MKKIILITAFIINIMNTYAQVTKQWEHKYEYFGMSWGNGVDFVINNLNEPVVFGQQYGWEETPIAHLYKLNPQTGAVIWDRTPSYSKGQFIFCDFSNNIYVCGIRKDGWDWTIPFLTKYNNLGNQVFYKSDPTDVYGPLYSACFDGKANTYMLKKYLYWVKTTKYDSSGNIAWTNYYSRADTSGPGNISMNPATNEIIQNGYYRKNNRYNIFFQKIDSNGNTTDTAGLNINSLYIIDFHKLSIDNNSNIILSGKFTTLSSQIATFIYKLSPEFDTLWGKTILSSHQNMGSCLNVQNDGSIIINNENGLLKYDPQGNVLWSTPSGKYNCIITGNNNYIYACGSSPGNKYLTTKLDQTGAEIWSITEDFSSYSFNKLLSVKTDNLNNVYVHGTGSSSPASAISTIKYSDLTPINSHSGNVPLKHELEQNYPNPFNPSTKIRFSLPDKTRAILRIFDIKGTELLKVSYNILNPGRYEFLWNAGNYSSGIYFVRLETDSYSDTRKMILLK